MQIIVKGPLSIDLTPALHSTHIIHFGKIYSLVCLSGSDISSHIQHEQCHAKICQEAFLVIVIPKEGRTGNMSVLLLV